MKEAEYYDESDVPPTIQQIKVILMNLHPEANMWEVLNFQGYIGSLLIADFLRRCKVEDRDSVLKMLILDINHYLDKYGE